MTDETTLATFAQGRRKAQKLRRASLVGEIVALTVYILVYWFEPLPPPWNDWIFYAFILVAAWLAAIMGTLAWWQYAPGDPPRRMWGFFAAGFWAWAVGELVWLILRPFYAEFPEVFVTDLLWSIAYIAFAAAVFEQYRLIYRPNRHEQRAGLMLLAAGMLLAPLALAVLLQRLGIGIEYSLLGLFLWVLYPIGDLVVGLSGVHFSRLFGRGLLGRAWWGLVAFAISDGISTWYGLGGSALLTEQQDLLLSLLTDTLYFGAYVLVARACLLQYLLLKYGPPAAPEGDDS